MNKIKFDPDDWRVITDYLKQWDEWRKKEKIGRPDYTSDGIYLVPYTIALLKSQDRMEELTKLLIFFTITLIALTLVLIMKA